ncbi:unnamed protein product [Amoebophrya sp. A25]|nr:unnamed protein product [Amoebophrya sp. A25]|eukprot:GSA25T00025971001.1
METEMKRSDHLQIEGREVGKLMVFKKPCAGEVCLPL